MNVKAQYKFDKNAKFIEMYKKFGTNYEIPCIRYATNDMVIETAKFPLLNFYKNLTAMALNMRKIASDTLE